MQKIGYFQTIQKTRLSDEIARQIVQVIDEGRFREGERLPPLRELAITFDVSRPILQEAISILQIIGYVNVKHGKGVYVKDPNKDIINVPISTWLRDNGKEVTDFYEARLAIETICAAKAAELASRDEVIDLQNQIKGMEPLFEGGEISSMVGPDIDFHRRIASLSKNVFLKDMLDSVISPENDIRKIVLRLPGHKNVTHADHVKIVEAIAEHNPKEARQAMINALSRPLKAISEYLDLKE